MGQSLRAESDIVLDTARRNGYQAFIGHLAKQPLLVTGVTFFAGAAVTAAVLIWDGSWSVSAVVSLLATLWALFFAVMIYLLTAEDTDNVLRQISDLQEQLSEALSAPGDSAQVITAEGEEAAVEPGTSPPSAVESAAGSGSAPPSAVGQETRPAAGRPDERSLPEAARTGSPFGTRGPRGPGVVIDGTEPGSRIADHVPGDLLNAFNQATGIDVGDLTRAWTRDAQSARQWVLERDSDRWLVFSRGHGRIGVIPLSTRSRGQRRPPWGGRGENRRGESGGSKPRGG